MALDGVTLSSLAHELKETLVSGRIDKIYLPEKDEVILVVRSFGKSYKLLLSVNSSNPRIHLTDATKNNPASPPMFCMILRKYLSGGRITNITQPNFERIINIHIESLNELGDMSEKKLIIEIMGKHSNIILVDENDIVLDSIKRVNFAKSSVREILPTRQYVLPPSQDKLNPLELEYDSFLHVMSDEKPTKIQSLIYKNYSGISPLIASELCFNANVDPSLFHTDLTDEMAKNLFQSFNNLITKVKNNDFVNVLYYDENLKPFEFSVLKLNMIENLISKYFDTTSSLVEQYYSEKDNTVRINQKTVDIRKILSTTIERFSRKIELQEKTIKSASDREKYKLFGVLITSNMYSLKKGDEELIAENYNSTGEMEPVKIKLDPNLTPSENAQKYFKIYNKKKRAEIATTELLEQNLSDLEYLETINSSLNSCTDEADIEEIRQELIEMGVLKFKKSKNKKKQEPSKPLHFVSSDGFSIYVGKNNMQNDYLTIKFAENDDMWFHTKDIPGSHVIVKSEHREIPNSTLEEAANLAAYYSKGQNSTNIAVDYTPKKFVKKPNGSKPGMVIYTKNKTAFITPNEKKIREMKTI